MRLFVAGGPGVRVRVGKVGGLGLRLGVPVLWRVVAGARVLVSGDHARPPPGRECEGLS